MTPVVILVNGASSSGKSTLCRSLQERLTDLADGDQTATFATVAFDDKFRLIADKLYAIDFVKRSGGDLGRLASRKPHDGHAAAADGNPSGVGRAPQAGHESHRRSFPAGKGLVR
jgi:hypothetical protein